MTLWEEFFNPEPIQPFTPTLAEFNKAWNWIFTTENPCLALTIIRRHSLALKRAGNHRTSEMAAIAVFRRMNAIKGVSVRNLPIRRNAPIIPKCLPAE